MLANVNDGQQQAHQLGELLQGKNMVINLIPWNPVYSPGIAFSAPSSQALTDFQTILRTKYKLPCTVRQEKGQDISGAWQQWAVVCLFTLHYASTRVSQPVVVGRDMATSKCVLAGACGQLVIEHSGTGSQCQSGRTVKDIEELGVGTQCIPAV